MKYVMLVLCLSFAALSWGQQSIFNSSEHKTEALKTPQKAAQTHFTIKYHNMQPLKATWKKGLKYNSDSDNWVPASEMALFRVGDLSYIVIYDLKGNWLGTEIRKMKKGTIPEVYEG